MNWGWIVSVAVLAPNLLWMVLPTVDAPSPRCRPTRGRIVLAFLEHAGRIALIVLPVFYNFHLTRRIEFVALSIMLVALGIYYSGWVRFFSGGRTYRLLFSPMWQLPVPLAVTPTIVFLSASVLFHSWLYAIVATLFGVIHVSLSLAES